VSMYSFKFPTVIVYMLQSTEYEPEAYIKWLLTVNNFNRVIYRKNLVKTRSARALLGFLRLAILAQVIAGLHLILTAGSRRENLLLGCLVIIAAPIVWAYLVVIPLLLGRWFIIKPSNWLKIRASRKIFAEHPGVKIAVAGSYGKTSMKEMLQTVISEGKKTAATPANKNVPISHALFARKLAGDEEVLIIEYGEGAPGDVRRFAKTTRPNIAVITGLAPAHLDKYKTLKRAGEDIFSVAGFVGPDNTYVNGESPDSKPFIKPGEMVYGAHGIAGWKVTELKMDIKGLRFNLTNGKHNLKIKTNLLGRHQIGPLAAVAALAHRLCMDIKDIEAGLSKIEPFEHRMSPYQLSGAWIIDDTYNGNIEGVKAGLELLKDLPAKRKIYITPGLVDQGRDSAAIHRRLGEAIKAAAPDQVVLMKHSVTKDIIKGLDGYGGQLIIEDDPLDFYNNLDKFVAAGDLVLMQNDWPDNYN
jgi:UDP-N-acetylmuramoyl-tripeptide--D-alanyl-D-alanine ligase